MQVVEFTLINKVVDGPSIFLFIPLRHTSNNGCIIRKLLEVTVHCVVTECVEGEKEKYLNLAAS